MFCKVKIKEKNYNCYYETYGDKNKPPLVLLHGWGVDSSIFNNIIDKLNYYCILIDFIGFGKSDKPIEAFSVDDYVIQVNSIINHLKIQNYSVLGHSFGGRVAIKYNYYYNINSLILSDSAGIKKTNMRLKKKIIKYKILKRIYYLTSKEKYQLLIENSGSRDYKALSPIMKQTMNKVIKEDLKKYCLHRRTKTLLLWGINDSETPLKDGYTFYNLYEQSRMIIFYKSGHFPHLDEQEKFIRAVNDIFNVW